MNKLKDKVAIVTGGASGIGKALCEELGRRGVTVIVADINEMDAMDVAAGIRTSDGKARGIKLDVINHDEINALIETTKQEYESLDYIFNNAGINIAGEVRDLEIHHWQSVINVNFYGVLYGTISAYRIMLEQGYGHIINISSVGGLVPMPCNAPYCAAKHAVVGMTRSLRAEAADFGVKISVVCPGFVNTGLFNAMTMIGVDKNRLLSKMPIDRLPNPIDAARNIIRCIERDKVIIVYPLSARILWRISTFFPMTTRWVGLKIARRFREYRTSLI